MSKETLVTQNVQQLDLSLIKNGLTTDILQPRIVNTLKLKSGDKLKIIQKTDTEEVLADNVIALKTGNDLQLSYADGTIVYIEDFYTTQNVLVELPSSVPSNTFNLNSSYVPSGSILIDGTNFIYSSGETATLSAMSLHSEPLHLAVHDHMNFVHAPRFADAGVIATDAALVSGGAAAGIGATQVILGALAIGGVAAVAGGGGGGGSSTPTTPSDTTPPTATITLSDTALKIGDTATVTIVFSEAVAGFSNADVTPANGTLSTFTSTDNITWTATFTPTTAIEDTTNVITLANTYTDVALNTGTIASSANYTVDTLAPSAPTVSLTSDTGESSTDKITDNATVTVTAESGATVQYSIDGNTWLSSQPSATGGSNTLHVRQTDAAGNVSATTQFTFTLDTTAPTLSNVAAHSATNTIELIYDSALDATHKPDTSDFTIYINSTPVSVSSVSITGSTITLTMASSFTATDSIEINYVNPGTATNLIQDIAGNDAAIFYSLSNGIVADGYVRGADIYIELADGTRVPTGVITDENGNFFLPPGTPTGSIVAVGGINIDTGVPNTMELKAPVGSSVINPLTTLVQAVIEQSGGTTDATAASAQVVSALGLTSGTDLTTFDPISSGDTAAQKAAATIATISILAGENSSNENAQALVLTNLVEQVTQSITPLDLGDSGLVGSLLDGVSVDAEAASAIADASSAIASATDLSEISQAQSQFLDTIAPGASTIIVASTTNDTTPSIRVNLDVSSTDGSSAVKNDTVALIVNGIQVATATISENDLSYGYVSFDAPTLTEGIHTIAARVIDQAGNVGTIYTSSIVTVDTTAPTSATLSTVTADNIINLAEKTTGVILSGTTEAGSTVALTINGTDYQAVVNGTSWSYTLSQAQIASMGEGAETLSIRAQDSAGNTRTSSYSINVDTTPSNVMATITNATDNVLPNTGDLVSGSTTNDNTLILNGTLTSALSSGDKLAIYDGTTLVGYATTNDTSWSCTTPSLNNAAHDFSAKVIDSAGNSGVASTSFNITINADVPTTLATITNTDAITKDATPTLTGTVNQYVSGEKVVLYDGTTKMGEVTLSGTSWTYNATSLQEGTHNFKAVIENSGGNQGSFSTPYALTIDTTAPTAPTLNNITSDDVINSIEKFYGVTITGTTEAGSTVTVNGTAATVNGTTWSYRLNASEITTGTATIVAKDAAGNESTLIKTLSVDTTAPTLFVDINAGVNINKAEKDGGVIVSGEAPGASHVTIQIGNNVANSKTAIFDTYSEAWSYTLTEADFKLLGTDSIITVTAIDAAGNTTIETTNIHVDAKAPTLSPLTLVSDTGTSPSDRITNDTTSTFSFTAENGSELYYSINDSEYVVVPDSNNPGSYIVGTGEAQTLTLPTLNTDSNYTISIKAIDNAGNETIRSTTFTLDTAAPTLTINPITTDDIINAVEKSGSLTLTGTTTAQAGQLVTLGFNGGTSYGTYTQADGTWSLTLNSSQLSVFTDANYTLSAKVKDIAGNETTQTRTFSVDTTAPTLTIDAITSDDIINLAEKTSGVTITGTNELGATVSVNGQAATVTGTTTWSYVLTPEAIDAGSIAIVAKDISGNTTTLNKILTIDAIAPSAPIITGITPDMGTLDNDAITNVSSGTLNGTAEANSIVNISINGTAAQMTQANAAGQWSLTYTNLPDGTYTAIATATDAAGNTSLPSIPASMTIDRQAPAQLSVALQNDTGNPSDVITSDAALSITSREQGAIIQYSLDGNTWSATQPTAVEGSNTLHVRQVDSAGNGSAETIFTYTLDTLAPTISINTITTDDIINATEKAASGTISGTTTAEDGQVVTVKAGSDTLGTATVSNGQWSVTGINLTQLSDASYTITADVKDAAGNAATQATKTFTVDATAPSITSATTASVSENIATTSAVYTATSNGSGNTYSLSGADAGLFNIDATTGVVTCKASPDFENPTDTGTNNVYDIQVIATDAAGNASIAQNVAITVQNIDVTVNDVATDNIINLAEKTAGVTITGTNEPNATVTVNNAAATVTGTSWSYTLDTATIHAMGEGSDTLNIVSGGQNITKTINIDTLAPVAPIVTLVTDAGPSNSDKITKVSTVTVSNIESGATVEYSLDGVTWSTAQPAADAFVQGINTLHVKQTDAVGNASAITDFTFTYDTVAPEVVGGSSGSMYSSLSDATHITSSATTNVTGAVGIKLVDASGNTIGSAASYNSGTATLTAVEQTSLTKANLKAYDMAGNAITSGSNFYLGTASGETITAEQSKDVLYGFSGTDTFVLASGTSTATIADYESGESISMGTISLWSSANAPTNWTIANGIATYTGSNTPSDLATQFFTDFAAATGVTGAVVGLVANGKTYIFGEGSSTADTDNYKVRIVDTADTQSLSIVDGKVQLSTQTPTTNFDISSLIADGENFYIVNADDGDYEMTNIYLDTTSRGLFTDYTYTNSIFSESKSGEVSVSKSSDNSFTITHGTEILHVSFSGDKASTVQGATGLRELTANFEVTQASTVQTTTDWWNSYLNGQINAVSLEGFKNALINTSGNIYSIWISDSLNVVLQSDGTLKSITYDQSGFTLGATVSGGWTYGDGYLIVTVPNERTVGFKMQTNTTTLLQTEIDPVGSTWSETWYYGPTLSQFQSVLGGMFDSMIGSSNHAPVLDADATVSIDENTTSVGTFAATDTDADALTYTILGTDAAKFTINGKTGALSFKTAPDFETPLDSGADNVYNLTVNVSDGKGGTDSQNVAVTVNNVQDTSTANPLTLLFMDNSDTIYVMGLDAGATYTFRVDGGAWQTGQGNSFIVSTVNGTHHVEVQSSTEQSATQDVVLTAHNTMTPMVTISNATLEAPLTSITAFPNGAVYTDGWITLTFDSTTHGVVREPDGTIHEVTLGNGVASFSINSTTYTYKLISSSATSLILGQTDTDLNTEMNTEMDGPPAILTLVTQSATAVPVPTSGSLTLFNNATDNFGDYGMGVKTTIDFANHTITNYSIDNVATITPFTLSGTTTMQAVSPIGTMSFEIIATPNSGTEGYYILAGSQTLTSGLTSSQGATLVNYLLSHNVIESSGSSYKGIAGTDRTTDVMVSSDGKTVSINFGQELQLVYTINNDGFIQYTRTSTHFATLSTANPFNYVYTYDTVANDTTPPVFQSASASSNMVTLLFDDVFDMWGSVSKSLFSVKVNNADVAVNNATIMGNSVQLILAINTTSTDTITVTYTDPTTGANDANVLQNRYGVDVMTFTHTITPTSSGGGDTTPPAAPIVSLVTDGGISSSDKITNTATVNVSNAESGATVYYSLDGTTWVTDQATLSFVQGMNVLHVKQTDTAGNTSSVTDFTFTYDTVAPAKAVTAKGILNYVDASNVLINNLAWIDNSSNQSNGVYAKLVVKDTTTHIGLSSSLYEDVSTTASDSKTVLHVNAQSTLTETTAQVYDVAGNMLPTSSSIFLGTNSADTITASTEGDVLYGFGGNDLFTVKVDTTTSATSIADYASGDSISFGMPVSLLGATSFTGSTTVDSVSYTYTWSVDGTGKVTFTGTIPSSVDVTNLFFTDFAAKNDLATGSLAWFVYSGRTYLYVEGSTDASDARVRMVDTEAVSINSNVVTLTPKDFDTDFSAGKTFYTVDSSDDGLWFTAISLNNTSGSYTGFNYEDNGLFNIATSEKGTFAVTSATTHSASVTIDGHTENVTFSNFKNASIDGVSISGLKQVTATFTVTSPETLASADWWESGYLNGSSTISLEALRDRLTNVNGEYPIGLGDDGSNLQIALVGTAGATSGTLVNMLWDGTSSTWTDTNNVSHTSEHYVRSEVINGGTWTLADGYLTISVPHESQVVFKLDGGQLYQTELSSTDMTHSEIWYYGTGVTKEIFADTLADMAIGTDFLGFSYTIEDASAFNLATASFTDSLAILDASNGLTNTLSIDAASVLSKSPNNTLSIDKDANDTLDLTGWTQGATEMGYTQYTQISNSETATLYVHTVI